MLHLAKRLLKVGLSLCIGIGLCCITLIAIAYPNTTPDIYLSNPQGIEQFNCQENQREIYNDLDWIVKLCTSDPTITETMDIYLNGTFSGSAVYAQIYHRTVTNPDRVPQVAVFYATGFIRLKPSADPPQGALDFGASAILGVAYWSDSSSYHHNPHITELHLDTSALPTGSLQIDAIGVNQNFNIGYAMELPPPTDARTELYVSQTYTATAPVTIPLGRYNRAEGFKLVQLSANYVNSTTHDSDAAGFITPDGRYREVLFEQLTSQQSFFTDTLPLHPRYHRLDLTKRHDPEIDNFPNIRIEIIDAPDDPPIIPRGWYTETIDPFDNNVNVWLSSSTYPTLTWRAGQTSSVRYRIIAQTDPLDFGCPVQASSICVLDEDDKPVADALVYRTRNPDAGSGAAKTLLGQTDIRGLLPLSVTFDVADNLVALQLVHEQPTDKAVHHIETDGEDFAFRVYRTTMPISDSGKVTFPVISTGNQHVLRISPQNPLVLFHVVVSIEAEVSRRYVNELLGGLQKASDMLYDATDGAMAFGWVSVWDGREHFEDADIQIYSNNLTWPYAHVGGITTNDPQYHLIYKGINPSPGSIVLGPYFDGTTSARGAWNKPNGFSTIVHEFAHYALFLFDEYFYIEESNGSRLASYCFADIKSDMDKPASLMDYQFTTTEFCTHPEHYPEHKDGPPTYHTQKYGSGETSWATIQGVYSDTLQQMHSDLPPWEIRSPVDRGVEFVHGPKTFPLGTALYDHTDAVEGVDVSVTKSITVTYQGKPIGGALISLHLDNGSLPQDQGITDQDGGIDIRGGAIGDRILVRTIDNGYAGSLVLTHTEPELLELQPVLPAGSQTSATWPATSQFAPLVTSIPGSNGTSMIYHAALAEADLELTAELHSSQSAVAKSMSYSDTAGLYAVTFGGFPTGTNLIDLELGISPSLSYTLVSGIGIGNHRSWTDGTIALEITSPDGNIEVNAAGNHLTADRYVAVNHTYALPGPPPAGMAVVSGPYSVQGSASETGWGQPMALTFNYHSHARSNMPEGSLQPYYWLAATAQWVPVTTAMVNHDRQQVSASSKLYGIYALMGTTPKSTELPFEVFLPVVQNQ